MRDYCGGTRNKALINGIKMAHYIYSVAGSIFTCILLAFWSLIEPANSIGIGLGGSSLTFHIRGFQLLTHSSYLFVQA